MDPTLSFPENKQEFECVEPELGARLSEYADPNLDSALRLRLEQHLEICHACRERAVLERGLHEILTEEHFAARFSPAGRAFRLSSARLWTGAGLALAAALALAIMLPPKVRPFDLHYRGGEESEFAITRPIEGEVLGLEGGGLTWTELAGASAYRVSLMSAEGNFHWEAETEVASLDLPEHSEFPGKFLVAVEPVPADLHPQRETSVAFSRGRALSVIGFRLAHPHPTSLLLALGALALGLAAIIRRT